MIIFGVRTRVTESSEDDVLKNSCPNCGKDLVLSDLKQWFTLYFIPIFPVKHIETLYHCKNCDSSYKQSIKSHLQGNKEQQENIRQEGKRVMAVTLAACMTHMAKIDGKISESEKKEIKHLEKIAPEFKKDIENTVKEVSTAKNNEKVYSLLRNAGKVLTADGIMIIIGQVARVVLADGKIDKKEEELMKEYMLVCGVPRELYSTIIEKVKQNLKKVESKK
jgi:uncharacterized tellurite resistance protein B-like protein